MTRFFSPRSYRNGSIAAALALSYLGLAVLLIVSAAAEAALPGPDDGGFFFGFAMIATLPLSFAVLGLYSTAATSQGAPVSDQYPGSWIFLAFAACGIINALLVWVIFRGRRVRPGEALVTTPAARPTPAEPVESATDADETHALPGWYPTPEGRRRYWDGRQWTEHFAVAAAPPLGTPYRGQRGSGLKWTLVGLGVALVVGGGSCVALLASGGGEQCDPEAVDAFQSLPPFPGVEVELDVSPGIGCTDTVQPPDPDAFLAHYDSAMRDAGWTVETDTGVWGKGPSGGVRVDRLEGNDVGVYVLSPSEYSP